MEREIHYYGDLVRRLFFGGAIFMLISLPFVSSILPFPIFASLIAIIALSFVAGLTNPMQSWVAVINEIIAISAVLAFEYYAITYYENLGFSSVFAINQILALNFLVALYYQTKNLRGIILAARKQR